MEKGVGGAAPPPACARADSTRHHTVPTAAPPRTHPIVCLPLLSHRRWRAVRVGPLLHPMPLSEISWSLTTTRYIDKPWLCWRLPQSAIRSMLVPTARMFTVSGLHGRRDRAVGTNLSPHAPASFASMAAPTPAAQRPHHGNGAPALKAPLSYGALEVGLARFPGVGHVYINVTMCSHLSIVLSTGSRRLSHPPVYPRLARNCWCSSPAFNTLNSQKQWVELLAVPSH